MACGSGKVTIQLVDEEAGPGAQDPKLFRGQSYEAIQAACLDEGILFRDPYFPAGPDALGYDQLGPDSEKAKGEFCAEPQFICEDMSRTDVCQGRLGNCWFLAAAASLTLHPRLLHRVVPPEQGFRENYAGVFHFQLWQFGCWVDVVVDDRLPVREGKLMFVRSEQRNEFWAPLLEKAYAKLHGSYEVMRGGHMNEAFVDFTGGVGEVIYLRQDTPGLFSALRHALAKESLVGATALSNQGEYRTEDGLVKGHAYSVTGTHKMSLGFTKVRLLRLRNPWGRVEWTGPWSDSCPRWDVLPPEWRDALLVRKEDGEFWMELQDFLRHFNTVQICSLSPEAPNIPLDLGLKLLFQELAGEEEELSAPQLQTLLSIALEPARAHSWTTGEIGLRTCEQLLQCFGHGRSLALHDFQQVWGHLREWQAIFDKFDQDTSGTMNSHELRLALNAAGFHLNNQLTQALTSRYRDSRLRVDLERFVSCVAQLTCIFCRCSQHLDGGEGVICLTRQQVSLGWREWHRAACLRGLETPASSPLTVFSHPVDGDGPLLLGSWQGSACGWRQESCRSPAFPGQPGPGFIPQQGGPEPDQPPAPPPPCLAWG
ncbi:Calpain-12 [Myotis davidii]|uniref:Calpain-12 n=1 Tax=Myotis davidii TaxID=225400 RepID=L5M104_MYODS|nr:Calpain-12 [Myotis davidii]